MEDVTILHVGLFYDLNKISKNANLAHFKNLQCHITVWITI